MAAKRFPSKIDIWLAVIAAAGFVVPLILVVSASLSDGFDSSGSLPLAITLVAGAFVVSLFVDTSYTVTDEWLLVRCGPVRQRILLAAITDLRSTRSLLSAPALSLDRIEVRTRERSVVISPRDRSGFAQAIRAAVPVVRIEGLAADAAQTSDGAELVVDAAGRSRGPGQVTVAILLLAAPVCAVGALAYASTRPVRVSVSPRTLVVRGSTYSDEVAVADIVDIALESALPPIGLRTNGSAFGASLRGNFKLRDGRKAHVFIERGHPPYIAVTTGHDFLLFNDVSPDRTRELYNEVLRYWRPADRR